MTGFEPWTSGTESFDNWATPLPDGIKCFMHFLDLLTCAVYMYNFNNLTIALDSCGYRAYLLEFYFKNYKNVTHTHFTLVYLGRFRKSDLAM